MALTKFINPFIKFIDWFSKGSPAKKIYIVLFLSAYIIFKINQRANETIERRDNIYNNRIDDLTNKLERCNSDSKTESSKIIQMLQRSNEKTQQQKFEIEYLRLEIQKLKIKNRG